MEKLNEIEARGRRDFQFNQAPHITQQRMATMSTYYDSKTGKLLRMQDLN